MLLSLTTGYSLFSEPLTAANATVRIQLNTRESQVEHQDSFMQVDAGSVYQAEVVEFFHLEISVNHDISLARGELRQSIAEVTALCTMTSF